MRKHLPLAAILALAAAVRLWGVDFGLPHTLARPDEDVVFGVARDIFKGDLNPHFFSYPSFFLYVVAALYSAYFWLGRAFGWFASEAAFLHQSVVHVGPFVLMARLVSVAAGTATVWVLFRTARRLFDQTTALVAALFLAFAVLHVRDSHFGVTDVTAALFLLVSFLFVVRLADTENLRDLVMAGLTAGLAASTKYNAALIVLPAFWVLVGPGSRRPATWTRRGLGVATYGGTALVGFLLASPYVALDWPAFREALQFEALHLRLGHGVDLGQGWSAHLFTSLGSGFGMVPLAIGVAGLLVLLRRDWRRGILVAVFPIAYYLALGSSRSVFVRYMIPVVPFLCLGAAVAVVACAGWAADRLRRPAWSVAMTWGLALLVAAPSVVRVGRLDDLLSRTD
ncbi:MAG: glycosyltransferase family 39 protein, partial [Acidobacteria bacterium]|nr:glycosyltransferase family 39 protein [Acidobacteriota bacterium]